MSSVGYYMFEDDNLDLFIMAEAGNTQISKGLNQTEERYEFEKRYHPHKRSWRSLDHEEFWESDDKFKFKIWASNHAQWRKFKLWIKTEL